MASLLNKTQFFSHLRSSTQNPNLFAQQSRGFHIDLGDREKALLEKDPALSKFKSHKQSVKRIKRFGDVLTIIVVAGCCYEIYVKATTRAEARKQE
ncbi:succinate dehydrogenase subunit 7A, mitochondrial-like [Silene latifolia]|uniref:succinate dehydrogenase subunit 7A, mitochondrial-like n=1 Tax=Silene latifolia TaxID=37657 RepID=UPI003D782495